MVARRGIPVSTTLAAGGVAVIVATLLVERFDLLFTGSRYSPADSACRLRLAASLVTLALPFALLGTCLPYVREPSRTHDLVGEAVRDQQPRRSPRLAHRCLDGCCHRSGRSRTAWHAWRLALVSPCDVTRARPGVGRAAATGALAARC